jgi:hypothetical protein
MLMSYDKGISLCIVIIDILHAFEFKMLLLSNWHSVVSYILVSYILLLADWIDGRRRESGNQFLYTKRVAR